MTSSGVRAFISTWRAESSCFFFQRDVAPEQTQTMQTDSVEAQPEEGTYVHGLFIEGAGWDLEEDCIQESKPKELYPAMPMVHIRAVTVEVSDALDQSKIYTCPIYMTTIRGPTFVFSGPLKTRNDPKKWVLAGVALVMQPDKADGRHRQHILRRRGRDGSNSKEGCERATRLPTYDVM